MKKEAQYASALTHFFQNIFQFCEKFAIRSPLISAPAMSIPLLRTTPVIDRHRRSCPALVYKRFSCNRFTLLVNQTTLHNGEIVSRHFSRAPEASCGPRLRPRFHLGSSFYRCANFVRNTSWHIELQIVLPLQRFRRGFVFACLRTQRYLHE